MKIDHAERRHVGDRRQSAFPDLHERLENKRLAIEHERRRVNRREADRRAVHHAALANGVSATTLRTRLAPSAP